jgi:hypothetical protein
MEGYQDIIRLIAGDAPGWGAVCRKILRFVCALGTAPRFVAALPGFGNGQYSAYYPRQATGWRAARSAHPEILEGSVKLRRLAISSMMFAGGLAWLGAIAVSAASAATPVKPAVSPEASAALARMGRTLQSKEFSFQAQTIRVYFDKNNELLHIFHTLNVTVRRPDRLLVDRNGDDGPGKLVYDGKTVIIDMVNDNKYASIPVPDTIDGMMKVAMGRLGVDFPLADFLSDTPAKAFLTGVTSGQVVNTVTIDGVPCLHLFFSQPPGINLELWLEKNDQSLPRRLIVTYRSLPGQPDFVAVFSNWNLAVHPTDADFVFQPPPGAVQVALKPPPAAPAKPKGSKP